MTIDAIGFNLLWWLVEAHDAFQAVSVSREGTQILDDEFEYTPEYMSIVHGYWDCADQYENAAQAFLSHLLIMPCPQIDTSAYEALWKESLKLTEDERENGKLWDAVDNIAQRAIALYQELEAPHECG